MATYNGAKYIYKQLNSILVQLKVDDEVVIIDDFSSDDTINIINGFNDKRIKLFRNLKNQGVVYSFNKALSSASGEIIFLSDQDDEWELDKVDQIIKIFEIENLDLIIHDSTIIANDKILHNSLFSFAKSGRGFFYNLFSNTFTGCCMSFRSSVLNKVLPIPSNRGVFHDSWIGVLSELYGFKIKFINISLIRWNRHGNNTSSIKRRLMNNIIIDRLCFIFGIVRHVFSQIFN
jgi:glycosyltransferase involved in cell wall biosynthesis